MIELWHISDFQCGFRSSRSAADLLTVVVSGRIARAFNRSWATPAVAHDIPKAFDRVWHAGLRYKRRSYRIAGHIFTALSLLFSVIQGGPQKCPYFSLAITFTKIRKSSRFFLHRYCKFIEFVWWKPP